MPSAHRPWDEDDDETTPYDVSGEPLPQRKDALREMDVGDEVGSKPRRKAAIDDDATAEVECDEPPARKKRRKRDLAYTTPAEDLEREQEEREHEKREWIVCGALFVIGFVLMIAGAAGLSTTKDYKEIPTLFLVLCSLVGLAVAVPTAVIALTIGGSLFGIEYGTPLSAIRNITAIFMFCDGIDWMVTWAGMPLMGLLLSGAVAFALFMSRFELDVWEVWASVIALKVVGIGVNVAVALAMSSIQGKGGAAMPERNPTVAFAAATDPVPPYPLRS